MNTKINRKTKMFAIKIVNIINDNKQSNNTQIMMKMDIEGSELEVIHDLILSGSFLHIDYIMVEWHSRISGMEKRKKQMEKESLLLRYDLKDLQI